MKKPVEILQKYWNHSSFREPQEEIITATLQKINTIVLLPPEQENRFAIKFLH